jgi:fatty-acyl-CoA synthase
VIPKSLPKPRSNGAVLKDWVRALETTDHLRKAEDPTLAAIVNHQAANTPAAPALLGTTEDLTYADLAARMNQTSRWALAQGLAPGDVVGLLMPNQPDYLVIWLGLTQIGCVVALLNTNLMSAAITHCLEGAAVEQVIVSPSLQDRTQDAMTRLPPETKWWNHGAGSTLDDLSAATAQFPGEPLSAAERRTPAAHDRALLIYTSGTTGMPKAAFVTHARSLEWSGWFAGMMDAQPTDRLYDCLPLYHSTGGVVAVGAMLFAGASVVIRERFSARAFWADVREHGCTIMQYIGELCRYLLQSPPDPNETSHQLRLCCGNGLRGDVWEAFQARFAIPRILEFYAATEGSVSLYNCEGKPGAIGRVPGFLAHRFPVALVRCDLVSGDPIRGPDGLCQRCDADEPGEALGLIVTAADAAARRFDGYTDRAATERKVLRDVFEIGDQWFRTGDLMRRDAAGYFYFVDRLGDTFRWKGENVATTEVAGVIGSCPGVLDAVVYGVALPGTEGKAGMAALVVDETFNLMTLHTIMQDRLPTYARPLFVRLCGEIARTGTMKLSKASLASEGYQKGDDPIWFNDRMSGKLVPFDREIRSKIESGSAIL